MSRRQKCSGEKDLKMGTGALALKKDIYYAVISYYEEDPTTGGQKRRQRWINLGLSVKDGKRKAKQKLNEALEEFNTNLQAVCGVKATEVIEHYLQASKERIAPTTYTGYHYTMERHIRPYFEKIGKSVEQMSSADINRYYDSLRKSGLSESSVARQHRFISAAFNVAEKDGLIENNPMKNVKCPTEVSPEISFYDIDQINTLLKAAKDSPIYTEILFGVYLGLRRGEILGLQWDCVNFKKRTIWIHTNVTPARNDEGKEVLVISEKLKTEKSTRELTIPDALFRYLVELKKEQERRKKELGCFYCAEYDGFICVDYFGKLHRPEFVTKKFKKLLKDHGLPEIHFHCLRHSCASMLLDLGVSMKAIQTQLGHSSYNTTANTYLHISQNLKREIAEKANRAIDLPI